MVGLTCVGIRLGLFSWRPETERRIQKEEWGSEEEEFRSTQGFHLGSRGLFEQVQPHLLSRSVLSNSTRRLTPRGSATFLRLESAFARAWSKCEQRLWGVWRRPRARGRPASLRGTQSTFTSSILRRAEARAPHIEVCAWRNKHSSPTWAGALRVGADLTPTTTL